MYEIIDDFCWEKHKKVITFDYHKIPGLKNFAYWNLSRAIIPTPMHYHSNIIEMHCLVKGKRLCHVEDKSYNITGNEVFITFPTEMHSTGPLPQNPAEFYAFQIDLKSKDNLLGLNKELSNTLFDALCSLKNRHLKLDAYHIGLLKKAFDLFAKGDIFSMHSGLQYLCCFIFNVPNLETINQDGMSARDFHIQKSIDYIEENFYSNIQLKDLAAIAALSLSRFKTKFKEEVGITPNEYITLRKIEYAKHELEMGTMSITDIAFEAGFSSSNYFCSVFKKLANCSPSEYRERFCISDPKKD
ncbi:AraC family transcriptional regulator [Cellulosilyticum sp. I15G10I2]|uniref:AraC family transcriptional regulator n=1 Tax=Cellulosilyticum sp. I15G10I2 TaxID=1892843 RepID=UPI00085BB409|nr:AraC family transcriptional regulator [Cellulosilyticum sp. I15G10I2]